MIRVCCICKKVVGAIEPLDDKSITHGYCEECYAIARDKITNTPIDQLIKEGFKI